jgi:transposase
MDNEQWRPVEEFDGQYEVSNLGGFRSNRTGRTVRSRLNPDGYWIVTASVAGKLYTRKLHRLVCRAFNGPPNALHREAAHLDGDRANPRADNLKWVSHRENQFHKRAHGTHQAGEKHPSAKLKDSDVTRILNMLAEGQGCHAIAAHFGVRHGTIESIKRRKTWRHIVGPPKAYAPRSSGPAQRGERNHNAKLSDAQREDLARRMASGEGWKPLALAFGLSRGSIYRIANDQAQRKRAA